MGRVLRGVGMVVLVAVGLLLTVGVGARFADGPIVIFPGGELRSGEIVGEPVADWSFVRGVDEIALQLVEPPRSRTVWIVEHDGSIYVPCGFLDVPLWKQWPHEVLMDGRVVLRIDGRRYERQALKLAGGPEYRAVRARLAEKYGLGEGRPSDPDQVWVFRMDPRPTPG